MSRGVYGGMLAVSVLVACSGDEPPPARVPDAGTLPPAPGTTVEVLRPITLTERARFPEQHPELIDVEVMPDSLVFVYSRRIDEIPFAAGDVVAGILHDGYLRRLTSVTRVSETRIEAATVHAELGELIGDGHFRVTFHPGDGTGPYAVPPEEDVGGARAALSSGWSAFTPELRGWSCGGGAGGSVTVTPRFDVDLGMEVDIDIQWSRGEWLFPRGEVASAIFAVSGAIEAGLTVNSTTSNSVMCAYNLEMLAMRAGIEVPNWRWTTAFAIGPVPITLTHRIEPAASITVGAEMETSNVTAAASGHIGLRAGASYTAAAGWTPIWMPTHSGRVSYDAPMPGRVTVTGVASVGVGYTVRLYDVVGPGFSFGPRLAGSWSSSADSCTWNAELRSGIELTGSVEVGLPAFDYKLASYSISTVVAETTWASGMGRFARCVDAGPSDAGPRDAGMTDAGTSAVDAGRPTTGSLGETCAAPSDCMSGFCVDGVCCNSRCDLECWTCRGSLQEAGGVDGTCGRIAHGTDPFLECTTPPRYCHRDGGCSRYLLGTPCTRGVQCDTGNCVDGVCCSRTGCFTCYSCSTAAGGTGPDGMCTPNVDGLPDTSPPTCSGTCMGGTCR